MHSRVFIFQLMALLAGILPLSAQTWLVKTISGRDYVPLADVASFYGLVENLPQPEKTLLMRSPQRELLIAQDSREATINGIKHWFCFPVIENDGKLQISRMDLGKTLEPAFRPERIEGITPFSTVVLDAGHGGYDRGAYSSFAYEKDFTLDLARRVRDLLKKRGLNVVMTRNNDTFVPLETRAAISNRQRNAIFVSLHFNSTDSNPAANGLEIFCTTPRGAPSTDYGNLRTRDMIAEKGNLSDMQSFALACSIQHSIIGKNQPLDRGVKRSRFAVLRLTTAPAVLVEGGFLSNAQESRLIASAPWRDKLAAAIVEGIVSYRSLAEKKTVPKLASEYQTGIPKSPNISQKFEQSAGN